MKGALDGQYAAWMNDTGVFDGVQRLTDGRVLQADLTQELAAQLNDGEIKQVQPNGSVALTRPLYIWVFGFLIVGYEGL